MELRELKSRKGREKFYKINKFEEGPKKPRCVPKKKLRKLYNNTISKSVGFKEKFPEFAENLEKKLPNTLQKARIQTADGRFLRTSARKMGAVLALVRGKKVNEALAILKFTNKKAARLFEKILKSAIANAVNNVEWDAEELYISYVVAEQGPTLPRIRPMSMGRVGRIRKRTCHVKLQIKEMPRKGEM